MRRFLPIIVVIGLGVGVAFGLREQFRTRPATPSAVPPGDLEVAWIHTTTNPQTWERFVAGVLQLRRQVPGLDVDDSRAFLDQTAAVPEVVLSQSGRPGKLHLRWYKLSSEVGNREWVDALAARNPAPIAFMGGGTSDRAIELAQALNERSAWKGDKRPLLFITTATANTLDPHAFEPERLIDVYPGRTFRGCFTNEAMARAVIDFVWQSQDLKPTGKSETRAYVLAWQDDPYSVDLAVQFDARFREGKNPGVPLRTVVDRIAYSVGTFTEPNPPEREVMDRILPDLASHPEDRSLLVLPAVTQPARRILRAFAADTPLIGQRLVAVTGDGVSFNTVFRDGDVVWPVRELSIPLVFFAHQNPVAWAADGGPDDPAALQPPNSTDDVLLFADIVRVLAEGVFAGEWPADADALARKLRAREKPFFAPDGERRSGEGEYVVVVRPQFLEGGRVHREPEFLVYTRSEGRWELVRRLVKQ
ncbi:MAG TPA: hypothetical protein VKE40_07925 [Gemmataceae bacterium]|nr:hypothetical protein [Gemmataceae bacterium]